MLGTSDLAVAAAAASVPGIKLNDGNVIPQIGLGLLRIENDDVAPVVKSALAAGYRHIDGAAGYNNEGGVGRALAETGFNKGASAVICGSRPSCATPSRGTTWHLQPSTDSWDCCSWNTSTCT